MYRRMLEEGYSPNSTTYNALISAYGKAGQLVGILTASATQLEATAKALTDIADRTNSQAATVAVSAEQSTGNVQMVAAATEQLTASVNEIRRQVDHSARIAETAVEDTRRTDHTVETLTQSADRIGGTSSRRPKRSVK